MSKTVLRRIDCHEAEELALALEAEEVRCQRGFAATQLLGLRLFGESAGSVCGHFASVAKACDRIFVLDKWSAVLVQPRQDEEAARRAGDNVLRFAGCPCALLLCRRSPARPAHSEADRPFAGSKPSGTGRRGGDIPHHLAAWNQFSSSGSAPQVRPP